MQKVIGKLHYPLQVRWRTRATKIGRKEGRRVLFEDMLEFMNTLVMEANDPYFGLIDVANSNKTSLGRDNAGRNRVGGSRMVKHCRTRGNLGAQIVGVITAY